MNLKGVGHDVGRVTGFDWRPVLSPVAVHRELEIIKNDLRARSKGVIPNRLE